MSSFKNILKATAPDAQIVKNEKNIKIIGKHGSCLVQCTNPLLLTHKY